MNGIGFDNEKYLQMQSQHILERMVRDMKWLLSDSEGNSPPEEDTVLLWNNQRKALRNGVSYGKKPGERV